MSQFRKYCGPRPLSETSIDDIPIDEQHAFFACDIDDEITDEDADRIYSAWYAAQEAYGVS